MFVSAYVLDYALAFDSVIVISLLCTVHRVPKNQQPRVVFWGLVGALVFRSIIVSGTVSLARAFAGTFYVLGLLAVYCGYRTLRTEDDEVAWRTDSDSAVVQKEHMPLARMLWRFGLLTDRDHGGRLWVIDENGRSVLTMAAACVLSIALADVVFALDCAVAIVSVSRTTFIMVTSNVLAAIALRSLYPFVGTIEKLHAPRIAITALLGVVGFKLLAQNHVHVPHAVWLAVIVALVGAAVAESHLASRRAGSR
jgi:tellurite resistance protein TerC